MCACGDSPDKNVDRQPVESALDLDREAIVAEAETALNEDIVTVTDFVAERSAGGLHDYYSEGRYWWPDDTDPDGPYVRRDGISNPENFSGHKQGLARFSEIVTTLTAAYQITGDDKYAHRAVEHIKAWFVDTATLMNPNLLYGQAIKGISTGRGIGIIDAIRLIDVALSVELLREVDLLTGTDLTATEKWFGDFGDWLTTHPYGDDEKNNNNNHSTWWGAQVAAYARVAQRPDLTEIAEEQFYAQLPIQVATDGGLPDELGRTKPFHYLNYTLRAWATYAELLTTDEKDFWRHSFEANLSPYTLEGADVDAEIEREEQRESGASKTMSLVDVMNYSLPYVENPTDWPYPTKLEPSIDPHQDDFLVLAYWGLEDDRYLNIWKDMSKEADDNHANLIVWQQLKK